MSKITLKKFAIMIMCAIVFGLLMALRDLAPNMGIRALIAGVAAGISCSLFLLLSRKRIT